MTPDPIADWHHFVETRNPLLLEDLLHVDAVFESPIVHTPQTGKAIAAKYLMGAMHVLGGPSFRYVGDWRAERSAVLEFVCEIDGVAINGADFIRWDEAGLITGFKVMVRPLKAMSLVHAKMGEWLAGQARA